MSISPDIAAIKAALLAKQIDLWQNFDSVLPAELLHFSPDGVPKILSSSELWCTDLRDVNDPDEITYGINLVRRIASRKFLPLWFIKQLQNGRNFGVKDTWTIYIACFTGNEREAMWQSDYGGQGSGAAIGFDTTKLSKRADGGDFALFPVLYDVDLQEEMVSSILDHAIHDLRLDRNEQNS